jgi:hypothetical protein
MRQALLAAALMFSGSASAQNEEVSEALQQAMIASSDLAAVSSASSDPNVLDAALRAQQALGAAALAVLGAPPYRLLPVMDSETFRAFIKDLQRSRTTSERMVLIGRAAYQHLILVDQLMEFLNLFGFTDERIRVAATVYYHLADPENFGRVYSTLNFETDRRKLALLVAGEGRFALTQ